MTNFTVGIKRSIARYSFEVQRKQPFQYFLLSDILRPIVRIEYSFIQSLMRKIEPCRTLILEIRQRLPLQLLFRSPLRMQPGIPLLDKLPCSLCNGLNLR